MCGSPQIHNNYAHSTLEIMRIKDMTCTQDEFLDIFITLMLITVRP